MNKLVGKNEDLYAILGLPERESKASKSVTFTEITKAYRKCALDCHPDKTQDKESLKNFQKVSFAYSILRSEEARKNYDKTGKYEQENQPLTSRQQDWTNLFRAMYDEVSEAEVKTFYKDYEGSADEITDLIDGYQKAEGNFEEIILQYALFDNERSGHVSRIKNIIDGLLKQGKISLVPIYKKTCSGKAIKNLEAFLLNERQQASEEASKVVHQGTKAIGQKKGSKKAVTDLQVAIMNNHKKMDDFVAALVDKYEDVAKAKSVGKRKRSG